ncbi:hypothetical protein DBV15_12769 [Temnothorax longispinosus]|uniref:Myb/SANT-like DNA-binding domain-containing protein 3 n=1 Tax=Temnothorax longispinosus TaxID=300112 RepID=A0A4S2KGA6_9HYME|nr:hypothetical protein DBV15_12769 [Temnothorax longispinosus]
MNAAKLNVQRKRAQNFSEKEKLILTEIVLKYKNIIENKRTVKRSKDKEKCWKVIENNYNSTSSSTEFRSAEVLKSCWENLKKKTRRFFADERIKLYKTGKWRTFCESQSDVVLERVRDIIKPSVEGIKSDCDNIEAKLSVQRKRAQNFSEKEKLILTEIVLKYKNIIENKRTDGVTSKDKEKCWKVIENNYNSTSSSTEFRSAEVLKSCWENLKKKTRKFFADERIQLYKTGK